MNTQDKYEENAAKELEAYRDKYAGKYVVSCATNPSNYFDFTNVSREDIFFGVHGYEYVKAKAKNRITEQEEYCFLKWKDKEAAILQREYAGRILRLPTVPNNNNATPTHYNNGKGYDLIDVIADYKLNFNRGNAAKYIFRAGKKDDEIKDLNKAIDYLQREIAIIKKSQE